MNMSVNKMVAECKPAPVADSDLPIEDRMHVNLYQQHVDFLAERCIGKVAIVNNELTSMSPRAATNSVFGVDTSVLPGDAISIPYYDLDGTQMIGDDGIAYSRIRVMDKRTMPKGDKPFRYLGRSSSGVRPFLPIGVIASISTAGLGYLPITEGELKAIAATAAGIPCCAISGVTMWSSRSETGIPLTVDSPIHPELIQLAQQAGGCVIVADSDATKNKTVQKSMQLFAAAMRKQAGVTTAYVHIPAPSEKDKKRGLDDWLYEHGGKADKVKAFLGYAFRMELLKSETMKTGGWDALGYSGQDNIVWSRARGCVVVLSATTVANPATLINVCGGREWCETVYGEQDKEGAIFVKWNDFSSDIIKQCIARGVFSAEGQRGSGVWRGEDGDLIVNSGSDFWSSSGKKVNRVSKDFVYPISRKLGITEQTAPCSCENAQEVLDALSTWQWKRKSDAMLLLGWIALGFLAGALKWRAHISLTGGAETGKSELIKFIKRLTGPSTLSRESGTSEAGIRQEMKTDAVVVMFDESEADGKKLESLLTLLRSASDDKVRSLGTTSQQGVQYTMRCMGLISGIVPPVFNSADATRYVCIELSKMVGDSVKLNPHRLISDYTDVCDGIDETYEIGRGMSVRMIQSWPRFKAAQEILRVKLVGSTRFRDCLCPILSAFWCMLNDEDITDEDADLLVSSLDLEDQSSSMSNARDEMDAFTHLLSMPTRVQLDGSSNNMTVAQLCSEAFNEVRSGTKITPYSQALGVAGMRVVSSWDDVDKPMLLIAVKAPGFRSLYKDTKWQFGDMFAVLKRVDGADGKVYEKSIRIGGLSCRPLCIDLSSYIDTHIDEIGEKIKSKKVSSSTGFGAVSKYM